MLRLGQAKPLQVGMALTGLVIRDVVTTPASINSFLLGISFDSFAGHCLQPERTDVVGFV
jgi:hypothetical protein